MRILVVTACGAGKNPEPMEAYKLYRSSRIKAVYNRLCGYDMGILSAEYGLVYAHEVIEPYEQIMDEERSRKLVPSVAKRIKDYDCVVFFKGGARKAYLDCIKTACEVSRKTLVVLGFANMGGIRDLPKVIELTRDGHWDKIPSIDHVQVFDFAP